MAWYEDLFSIFTTPKQMATAAAKTVSPWKQPTIQEAQQTVINVAAEMGLGKAQQVILCGQACLESGWFRGQNQATGADTVFKKNWNAFGMKMPGKRKSPYIVGQGSPAPRKEAPNHPLNFYAKYANLSDSVKDVIHLQNSLGINWAVNCATPEAYVAWLTKKGYSQGSMADYLSVIKKVSKDIVKLPGTVAGLGGTVLGLLVLALFIMANK